MMEKEVEKEVISFVGNIEDIHSSNEYIDIKISVCIDEFSPRGIYDLLNWSSVDIALSPREQRFPEENKIKLSEIIKDKLGECKEESPEKTAIIIARQLIDEGIILNIDELEWG